MTQARKCTVGDVIEVPLSSGSALCVVKWECEINRRHSLLEVVCFPSSTGVESLDDAVAWLLVFDEYVRDGKWKIVGRHDGAAKWPSPPSIPGKHGWKDGRSGVFGRYESIDNMPLDMHNTEQGLNTMLDAVDWLSYEECDLLPAHNGMSFSNGLQNLLEKVICGEGHWEALKYCKHREQVYRDIIQKLRDKGAFEAAWQKQREKEAFFEQVAKEEADNDAREAKRKAALIKRVKKTMIRKPGKGRK